MATIYVLCGIPGSGKTTLSRELAEQYNAVVRSYDDMPGANTRESIGGSVRRAWLDGICDDLKSGNSIICDDINLSINDRTEILSFLSNISCRKVLVVKNVPLETCLQRNIQREARLPDFVIEQAAQRLELPTEYEGWDEIIIYAK